MPATPTTAELLRLAIDANRRELHTAMPGVVKAVDAGAGTVDVQPQLQVPGRDSGGEPETLPILPDVPVAFPRMGGFSLRMPVTAGDTVLLVFCERDIGAWQVRGEPGVPGDDRPHSLAGAVAIPGLFADANALKIPASLLLGKEGEKASTIELDGSGIKLTEGASEFIARADRVERGLKSIVDAIKAGVPAPQDGGTALQRTIVAALDASEPQRKAATDNVKGT